MFEYVKPKWWSWVCFYLLLLTGTVLCTSLQKRTGDREPPSGCCAAQHDRQPCACARLRPVWTAGRVLHSVPFQEYTICSSINSHRFTKQHRATSLFPSGTLKPDSLWDDSDILLHVGNIHQTLYVLRFCFHSPKNLKLSKNPSHRIQLSTL